MNPEDDEVPVADAVEQQRDVEPPAPGDDSAIQPGTSPPLESTDSDWQQQGEEVDLDPEIEELRDDDEGT